jgi:tetratricopeptide (TPR) repeat protein
MPRTFALLLLALPCLAVPRAAHAELTAVEQIAEQIGTCFSREDPNCAEPLVTALQKLQPGSWTADYGRGVTDFLAGRLDGARAALQRVAGSTTAPASLREKAQQYLELAESTAEVHAGSQPHTVARGRVVVWIKPGPDEVLLPYLDRVLSQALPALETAFGKVEGGAIAVHIYPKTEDLSRVSGLTVQQIRASGTIALCKYNRLMVTSPADLVFGYPWADTVAHELVHWFVIKRGGPNVPVWMHEGLARSFEGAWRGRSPTELDPDERAVLAHARKHGKFITLQRMSPSMALLPTQDDTQLAFAEVHHALAWLLQHAAKNEGKSLATGQNAAEAGRLVGLFGAGQDEAQVVARLTGLSLAGFQAQWKKDLLRPEPGMQDASEHPHAQVLVFRGGGAQAGAKVLGEQAKKYAELGDRLAVLKRPQAAATEYRKAMAAGAQEGPLLVARLVRVLLDLGRIAEADEYLTPALQQFPEHAPLHVLRGRAEVAQAHWKLALDALDQAAWLNPYDPQLHALAGQAYVGLGLPGDAAAARQREQLVAHVGP